MIYAFLRFPGGKGKALTFSYDDGIFEDMRLARIFKSHGLKATFNINSAFLREDGSTYDPNKTGEKLTVSDALKTYDKDFFEVAVHTLHHPYLELCDKAVAYTEVLEDRKNIERLFGTQVRGMAYPYGTYNDAVVEIVKSAGIYYSRGVSSSLGFEMPTDWLRLKPTCHHKYSGLFELADKFVGMTVTRKPQLFYVWGHGYEFANDNNWEIIENFADKVSGKDDIWYATNIEIYRYVKNYERLQYAAGCRYIYNPTDTDIYLETIKGVKFTVHSGETVDTEAIK